MTLEDKLVQLRNKRKLSQLKVAEELGVSRQAISRWEVGAALPSTENLKKLAVLYGVPADLLLNDDREIPLEQEPPAEVPELPPQAEAVPEAPAVKKPGKKHVRIAIAVVLALGIFLLGYLAGYGQASREWEKNRAIPISELEEMPWDPSGAEEFVVTWPKE